MLTELKAVAFEKQEIIEQVCKQELNLYTCTRLIKKLVQVFLYDITENPNELFGQSNITANKKYIFKRV